MSIWYKNEINNQNLYSLKIQSLYTYVFLFVLAAKATWRKRTNQTYISSFTQFIFCVKNLEFIK